VSSHPVAHGYLLDGLASVRRLNHGARNEAQVAEGPLLGNLHEVDAGVFVPLLDGGVRRLQEPGATRHLRVGVEAVDGAVRVDHAGGGVNLLREVLQRPAVPQLLEASVP
jgi:hypothetical protein